MKSQRNKPEGQCGMLYFIVNEKSRSGKGAEIWQEVKTSLSEKQINYQAWTTEYAGHAFSLAKEITNRDEEDISLVVVGGDGTTNEAINGMEHMEKVRLGVIPTGSGNDLARGLHITGTPTENLEHLLACSEKTREENRMLDLGQVSWNDGKESRLFIISSGVGLDALVCKRALKSRLKDFLNKIHLGKLTYVAITVLSLFSMRTADALVQYRTDDAAQKKCLPKTIYIAAMISRWRAGGVPMAPEADASDGMLSMCSASGIPKWRTFFCLPFLVLGKHLWIRGFDVYDTKKCRLHLKEPMVLHADGEYCGGCHGSDIYLPASQIMRTARTGSGKQSY